MLIPWQNAVLIWLSEIRTSGADATVGVGLEVDQSPD